MTSNFTNGDNLQKLNIWNGVNDAFPTNYNKSETATTNEISETTITS